MHDHAAHGGDAHDHGGIANESRLKLALGITATFMLVEAAGGWIAGSLALIADAGHMLVDVGALTLSLLAIRASRRPADARRTYGNDRAQVVAALVNGVALIALSAWVAAEAVSRLVSPEQVDGGIMLGVAAVG